MGVHAAIAGLALGLQTSEGNYLGLTFAVLFHKWAEALTVGVSILQANMSSTMNLVMIIVFSLASPVGILVGMVSLGLNVYWQSLLTAASGGTFIYIATVEIISNEFDGNKATIVNFIFTVIGILVMVAIAVVEKMVK